MYVSLWENRYYRCNVIRRVFSLFFLIENICLIPCRYLFNLKKKVKNKTHVEALICEAYIVEDISIFISYFFEPHLRTRINRVPLHNNGGKVPSSGNLSIFSNPRWFTPKKYCKGKIFVWDRIQTSTQLCSI